MAYRASTQRQLRQLAHLVAEYVGDEITIRGPHPVNGNMMFSYAGKDRFGGFYVDRKGALLTSHEAGFPDTREFTPWRIVVGGQSKQED